MLRVIFSLAVALVIPCARMLSQDIRLSPEPTTTILSVDNRTVAAARIDSVTLIVWGTHIRGKAPNTVKNVLRTQIVRDTGLVDSSRILHSVAAYPSTYRKVFALHDRFLLLWDDRRSGTYELYAQVIDTTGRAVGEEVAIGEQLGKAGIGADHPLGIAKEEVPQNLHFLFIAQRACRAARKLQQIVHRAVVDVIQQLDHQRRNHVDGLADIWELAGNRSYVEVILGGMKPRPGEQIPLAQLVVRLMLVPKKRDLKWLRGHSRAW